jgi:hypothetical protein
MAVTVAEIRRVLNTFVLAGAHPALVDLATNIPSFSPPIHHQRRAGRLTVSCPMPGGGARSGG